METSDYLKLLTKQIADKHTRFLVEKELQDHIDDQMEAYISEGMSKEDALKEAVIQMGEPTQVGKSLNKIHLPAIDWKALLYLFFFSLGMQFFRLIMEMSPGFDLAQIAPFDILRILGIILIVTGLIQIAVEKYLDTPFFYGISQSGGAGALINGCAVVAIGIAGASHSLQQGLLLTFIGIIIVGIEREEIERSRRKKEAAFLWRIGIAQSEINYKGFGEFDGKKKRVKVLSGDIKEGSLIMITAISGFGLIVESLELSEDKPSGPVSF